MTIPGDCGEHSAHRVWKITPRDLVVTQVLQHLASVPENIINVSLCVRVLFLLHEESAEEKVCEVDVADHYDQVENLAHQELKKKTFIFIFYAVFVYQDYWSEVHHRVAATLSRPLL